MPKKYSITPAGYRLMIRQDKVVRLHVPETVVRIEFSLDEVKQQARSPTQYSLHHAFLSRLDVPNGVDADHLERAISPL